MKSLNLKHTLVLTAGLLLTACQASTPGLTGPQETIAFIPTPLAKNLDGEVSQKKFDPRVDILFVIDDSFSMQSHQRKLSQNIQAFVEQLAEFKSIDFHIGYTTVHDSRRYGSKVPAVCGPETSTPGRVNWEEAGSLRPLQSSDAALLPKDGRRFVTRNDNYTQILKHTLDPMANTSLVKSYIDPVTTDPKVCPQGAEDEESFTPLLGALTNPAVINGANKGFRRPGALFIAIIVSDAKDGSQLTPEVVATRIADSLIQSSPQTKPKFRVFAVVNKPGDRIGVGTASWKAGCRPDPAFSTGRAGKSYVYAAQEVKENPLATLAMLTQDSARDGQVLSICNSDYGTELAKFGQLVKQDVMENLELKLGSAPMVFQGDLARAEAERARTCPARRAEAQAQGKSFEEDCAARLMRVVVVQKKGANTIEHDLVRGRQWDYNVQSQSVIVYSQNVDWDKMESNDVRVLFTPADQKSKYARPLN